MPCLRADQAPCSTNIYVRRGKYLPARAAHDASINTEQILHPRPTSACRLGTSSRWLKLTLADDCYAMERCANSLFGLLSHCGISRHITVRSDASTSPFTVETMTPLPDPAESSVYESEVVRQGRPDTDHLISINDIRALFKLGRTAAYELTHRPGFPAPVQVSRRCLRWWASEVRAYAETLQREGIRSRARRTTTHQVNRSAALPRRITGTVRVATSRRQPE
jgi:predicted DNA-binding transcriptional regulator AlpA